MVSEKIFGGLVVVAVCVVLLAAGCEPAAQETVKPEVEVEERAWEAAAEEAVAAITEEPVEPEVEEEEVVAEAVEEEVVEEVIEEAVEEEVEAVEEAPEAAAGEAATLALKFTPGDVASYRLVTDSERSVKWEGALPSKSGFKSDRRQSKLEMTFTQEILSVDEAGNAVAKLTVDALKYLVTVKDKTQVDFDSTRITDPEGEFAKMLGHSFTIEIAPTGEVTKVIDAEDIRTSVRRARRVPRRALAFLRPEPLMRRHSIPALPVGEKKQFRAGETYSDIKSFSFGLMGSKAYEKIFTVKDIKETDGRQVALVEMNAIPTAEKARELYEKETTHDFSEEFDRTDTYSGQLKMDLTAGTIEECFEEMQISWTRVLQSEEQPEQGPAVLTMGESRAYSLKRID
ncbi:MAG: hypothetical protein JSW23_04700 [Planctomycetota bacterium]|nr:MAG: hypothetical protein JSW23_04700 [Planctomycetota bacterium]